MNQPAAAASVHSSIASLRPDLRLIAMTGAAFAVLFGAPLAGLARDWWTDRDAGHGLLLAPVAIWLAWRVGISRDSTPSMGLGAVALVAAIALRHLGGLAAEVFSTRISALLAIAGVVTFWFGWRQVRAWWLSFALLALAIPLPSLITTALTLPLQFKASAMGAALLEMRHVPVMLSGNIIRLPGHQLFVTEACSGLRSLTALLSLGVLIGGLWLRSPASRLTLVALAVPVGIVINAVRVFLTGFLVYFVSPKMGDGFMHLTEGWLLFLAAFAVLGICGWVLGQVERRFLGREAESHA